jgi:cytochrome c553
MKNTALTLMLALAGGVPAAHAQNAEAGSKKVSMCVGCHGIPGYRASFPEVHQVPMIAGQDAKYISAALNAYKKGDRKHPTMRSVAASMSDQDIADIAAFYAQQGKSDTKLPDAVPEAHPAVAALIARGACVSCHGANFSKPIDGSYPKIAGQHADYLFVALKSYKVKGNEVVGRANPMMGGIVTQFSNPELKAIAQYIADLPGEVKTVPESRFR